MWKTLKIFLILFLIINVANAKNLPEEEVYKLDNKFHDDCIQKFELERDEFIELYWNCKIDSLNAFAKEAKQSRKYDKNYFNELEKIKKIYKFRLEEGKDRVSQQLNRTRGKQTVFLKEEDGFYYNLIKEKFSTDLLVLKILKTKKAKNQIDLKDKRAIEFQIRSTCLKFKGDESKYNSCVIGEKNKQLCNTTLEESIQTRLMENKFECKKKAVDEYPDTLVLYNDQYEKLMNKKSADFVLNRKEEEEKQKQIKNLKKKLNGPKISKEQLLQMRKDSEEYCNFEKNKELELFKAILADSCNNF